VNSILASPCAHRPGAPFACTCGAPSWPGRDRAGTGGPGDPTSPLLPLRSRDALREQTVVAVDCSLAGSPREIEFILAFTFTTIMNIVTPTSQYPLWGCKAPKRVLHFVPRPLRYTPGMYTKRRPLGSSTRSLAHERKMYSIVWKFIESKSNRISRFMALLLVTFGSVFFSIPRLYEGWFIYSLVAYPILTLGFLELIKRLLRFLPRIRENSLALVKNKEEQKKLDDWWNTINQRKQLFWCVAVALFWAGISLVFNANPSWSRYTDAIGIFYIGFIAGEIAYLLLLVPSGIFQLKKYQLRFNPILPAQTINLQILAESSLVLALGIGISLLALNFVVAMASYLFHHLLFGIIFVSVLSWIAIISLSIYPQFILFGLVQQEKRKILEFLEARISEQYNDLVRKKEAASSIEQTVKLQIQVLESKSFPVSNSAIFSIITTMFLNALPVIMGFFIK
jgi:hypothetical protein